MQRLALGLLIGVVAFIALVAGLLVARGRSLPTPPITSVATPADYRMTDIRLSEELRTGVRWQLEAQVAEVYETAGRTAITGIRITIEQGDRTWIVTGDQGEFAKASRNVEIRGNVVLTGSDGLRLETERLRWAAQEERAWTDAPVVLHRPGAVVRGEGLEARVGEEITMVRGRVHATFTGAQPGGGAGGRVR